MSHGAFKVGQRVRVLDAAKPWNVPFEFWELMKPILGTVSNLRHPFGLKLVRLDVPLPVPTENSWTPCRCVAATRSQLRSSKSTNSEEIKISDWNKFWNPNNTAIGSRIWKARK